MCSFLLNMWVMRKVDKDYLQARIDKNITQQEYETIIETPQMTVQ